MAAYNFPDVIKGDTYNGTSFTMTLNGVAMDLTYATISMDLRLIPLGTIAQHFDSDGGGITIDSDPTTGIFVFDAQVIDLDAAQYYFDIEFSFSNNSTVKTYISGRWTVLQDITYT